MSRLNLLSIPIHSWKRDQMAEGPTMVIVGRADLSLSKGKFAAQVAHAAVKCALTAKRTDPRILDKWNESGARKVICEASNLDALKRLYGEARADGLVAELISDAGHTEIPAGTVTCLGIGPGPRGTVDSLTARLPLMK